MQRSKTKQRGQALADMGIVILLLVIMLFGIIEFGRMFMVANMITHAARDGARFAAVQPESAFSGGTLSDPAVRDHVEDLICSVVTPAVCSGLDIAVTRAELPDGLGEGVSVTVSGPVPYLFGFDIWGGALDFNRVVTFRAENG
jgi:hypothetical protein